MDLGLSRKSIPVGLALGLVTGTQLLHVKDVPGVCLVVLMAIVWLATRSRAAAVATAVRRVSIAFFAAGAAGVLSFALFLAVSPPFTADGHPVMAVGQVFGAWIISVVVFVAALWGSYRSRLRFTPAEESGVIGLLGVATLGAVAYHLLH